MHTYIFNKVSRKLHKCKNKSKRIIYTIKNISNIFHNKKSYFVNIDKKCYLAPRVKGNLEYYWLSISVKQLCGNWHVPIEAALERGRGRDIFWIFVQCCTHSRCSRCSGSVGGSVPSSLLPVLSAAFRVCSVFSHAVWPAIVHQYSNAW